MNLQLQRRLTHFLASTASSERCPARRDIGSSAPACHPGVHQEVLPLASANGDFQCFEMIPGARVGAGIALAPCTPANELNTRYWRGSVLLSQCACLDVIQPQAGAEVVVTPCSRRRKWLPQNAQLRHRKSGLCLDYTAALITPGARVLVQPCNASITEQSFALGLQSIGDGRPIPVIHTSAVLSTSSTSASSTMLPSPTPLPTVLPTPSVPPGYKLIWSDEFNAGAINTSSWNDVVDCANANEELQCYTNATRNAYVADGLLHIQVIKEPYEGRNYTSARLNTWGKFDFTYGYIEASIKLPCGTGLWPAFWLMPTYSVYGPWPQSGELDIMEFLGGDPKVITATAHFGANQAIGNQTVVPQGTFCDAYHRYGLQWSRQNITWSLDGSVYAQMTSNQGTWSPASSWPFDQPFYIILNVAMGGNWPGPPDPNVLNATMLVDFVRVYQN